MYNPVDCLVPGASGAPDSRQYKPAQRLLLRHGTVIEHEATRAAMRGAATWIHPSDITAAADYWYAPEPVPQRDAEYTAWVNNMRPAHWIAHVGAIGKSALDRRTRDPAFEANRLAQQDDAVASKYYPPARTPAAW